MIKARTIRSLLSGLSNTLQAAMAVLKLTKPKHSIIEQEINELTKATFDRYQRQVDDAGVKIHNICTTASCHRTKSQYSPHIEHHKKRDKDKLFDHSISPLPLQFRLLIDNLTAMEAFPKDQKSKVIVEQYKSKYVGLAFALSQAGLLTLKEAVFFSTPGQIKHLSHPDSCSVSFLPPKAEINPPVVDFFQQPSR